MIALMAACQRVHQGHAGALPSSFAEVHVSFSVLLPAWVGNLDNMQRLIKIYRWLPPFSGVEGEDRINGRIRYGGGVSIPRIEPCPGDDIRQPGGLLGTA
jgi:hypothetical protein